jgi:hypothetical protein
MTDDATSIYIAYLRDIATEAPDRPLQPPTLPDIPAPATFLMEFLQSLLPADVPIAIPITRHGMDAALDALFSHPALRPLLLDDNTSVALQQHFTNTILPAIGTTPATAFWEHIIRPAWDQHRDIQRIVRDSAQA